MAQHTSFHVNCFMAGDDTHHAILSQKCTLRKKGLLKLISLEVSLLSVHEETDEPSSAVSWCLIMTEGSPQKGSLVGGSCQPAKAKRHPRSLLGEQPEMGKACGLNFPFSVSFS